MVQVTKECNRCRCEKPLSAFHKLAGGPLGCQRRCKECAAALARARYERKRQQIIEQGREYRETHAEAVNSRNRTRYRRNREVLLQKQRERRRRERQKYAARWTVSNALVSGRIVAPEKCQECGTTGPVDAHHASYDRARWLDIEWLCKRCHQRRHAVR